MSHTSGCKGGLWPESRQPVGHGYKQILQTCQFLTNKRRTLSAKPILVVVSGTFSGLYSRFFG